MHELVRSMHVPAPGFVWQLCLHHATVSSPQVAVPLQKPHLPLSELDEYKIQLSFDGGTLDQTSSATVMHCGRRACTTTQSDRELCHSQLACAAHALGLRTLPSTLSMYLD